VVLVVSFVSYIRYSRYMALLQKREGRERACACVCVGGGGRVCVRARTCVSTPNNFQTSWLIYMIIWRLYHCASLVHSVLTWCLWWDWSNHSTILSGCEIFYGVGFMKNNNFVMFYSLCCHLCTSTLLSYLYLNYMNTSVIL
jgi:hypothetical protein